MRKKFSLKTIIPKIYTIIIIFLLIGIIGIQNESLFGHKLFTQDNLGSNTTSFTLDDIQKVFPEATKFHVADDSIKVYNENILLGWAYNSSPAADSIVGFASSVPLLIGFNNQDVVQSLTLLDNYESPDFLDEIIKSGLLENWNGVPINQIQSTKVDAVSGATLSSDAIIETLRYSASRFVDNNLSLNKNKDTDILSVIKTWSGYILLVLAISMFFFSKQLKRMRTAFQILIVLILGLWSGTFLSLFSFYNWTTHGIDLPSKLFIFLVLVLSILLPLFTGKSFYCSHMCPYGASQDLLEKFRKKRIKLPQSLKTFLSTLREKVFATIMLLLFVGVSFDLTNIEPFSAFLYRTASIPVFILALIFLILSIFIPRPWCNYACPTGYILELIRKPVKK